MKKIIKKSIFILKNYGLKVFLIRAIKFPYNRFLFLKQRLYTKLAEKNPQKIINKLKLFFSDDEEKIFKFTYKFYGGLIKPMQIKEEFLQCLKIFKEQKPKYVMEIGTASGGTLFSFCKLASEEAIIISIDLPGGLFGGGYSEWKMPIYQVFKKEKQNLYLLRKNSHQKETLEEVLKILNGKQLDFLFIDGDHTYEGVKKDFEMYSPLVKKGGIIVFHDIAVHPLETDCFVHDFWKEIKKRDNYKFKELIKDLNQNWAGIGILFLKI